jgi:hypothetical protein
MWLPVQNTAACPAGCYRPHRAPGKSAEPVGQGLNPAAPDLAESELDSDGYQALLATAAGTGHHAPGEEHGHGDGNGATEVTVTPESEPVEHDHSTHEHTP